MDGRQGNLESEALPLYGFDNRADLAPHPLDQLHTQPGAFPCFRWGGETTCTF